MKLGGRQSKNVDDIRKQKPKKSVGTFAFPASEGFTGNIELKATQSNKRMNTAEIDKDAKKRMFDKATGGGMDETAGPRLRKQREDELNSKSADDMSVEELITRDEAKRKTQPKTTYDFDGQLKKLKPTQLKEIWTPRPLNSKK